MNVERVVSFIFHFYLSNLEFSNGEESYKHEIWDGEKIKNDVYFEVDYSDSKSFHNWMTDEKLYCYSGFEIGLLGSLFFLGFAISGLLLKMSDYIGRLNIVKIGLFVQILCWYSFYFYNNIYSYYTTLFVLGLTWGKNMWLYILLTETCPKRTQMLMSSIALTSDAVVPNIMMTLYFYLGGKYWKHIYFPALIFPVIAFAMSFFIPESPRYLYTKKKYKSLNNTLKCISRVNGVKYQLDSQIVTTNEANLNLEEKEGAISSLEEKDEVSEYSIWNDLKKPAIVINLLITMWCFSSVSFDHYMLTYYIKYIGGNIFVNNLAIGVSAIAANLTASVLQKRIGTRYSLAVNLSVSFVFGIPLLFSPPTWLIALCCFVAKFGTQSGYPLMFYLNSELFHPLFVPFSFSIWNLVSRGITIMSPQVAEFPKPLPIILFLWMASLLIVATMFVRKTKNVE